MILNFQETFVPAVAAGTKPHSIRAGQRWRVGMPIQFYCDIRQPSMAKFRPDGVATSVQAVELKRDDTPGRVSHLALLIDGRELSPAERYELSRRDGFTDFLALVEFISNLYGLPFEGQLIHWTDLRY